jgi:hypothetical protein
MSFLSTLEAKAKEKGLTLAEKELAMLTDAVIETINETIAIEIPAIAPVALVVTNYAKALAYKGIDKLDGVNGNTVESK